MDEETKALLREAVGLYKRHVEMLEDQRRALTGWRYIPFALKLFFPVLLVLVFMSLWFHFVGF
jgi:hypothetical protein